MRIEKEKEFDVEIQLPEFRGRKLLSIVLQVLATIAPIAIVLSLLLC